METTKKMDPSETAEARAEYAEGANTAIGNVGHATVKFERVEGYTTFLAEHTIQESKDFVIHFFLPREAYKQGTKGPEPTTDYLSYWQNKFPSVLSATSMSYFGAAYPRIFAEWVPEMCSWYMKCNGFANRLDPATFIEQFFETLDEALDKLGVP